MYSVCVVIGGWWWQVEQTTGLPLLPSLSLLLLLFFPHGVCLPGSGCLFWLLVSRRGTSPMHSSPHTPPPLSLPR